MSEKTTTFALREEQQFELMTMYNETGIGMDQLINSAIHEFFSHYKIEKEKLVRGK